MSDPSDLSGTFINVEVSPEAASDPELAKKLEEACPVNIFKAGDAGVTIVEENLDECVLCNLCVDAAKDHPGSVTIIKLYE